MKGFVPPFRLAMPPGYQVNPEVDRCCILRNVKILDPFFALVLTRYAGFGISAGGLVVFLLRAIDGMIHLLVS